ncbi:MAG TPA: dihydrolipoamide acetyltransferase family protein [Gammaproteobacteria bacterium]|nr:dihydrolipoamide acetyltransferase family protein [Gammaproteobacteria bacterium]
MAEFRMPSLGADMESAVVTEWLVKPGDKVKRGDVVAAVETAKGIIDIEIFEDGVIETLIARVGDSVPVGGLLASYSGSGKAVAGAPQAAPPARSARPEAGPRPTALPATARPVDTGGTRQLASPAARKRAAELGIDLATLGPGHPSGAITLGDVERAAARGAAAAGPSTAPSAGPTDMRAVIAQAMSRAKREIPHYYLGTTIDMTRAVRFVAEWNAAHSVTERLLPGVLLIKAVALGLEKAPELNGFWRDGRFEPSEAINVGAATRLRRGGLVAPALEAANRQPLPTLMRQLQAAVERARAGRLRQTELASATITVSSLGEGGVETLYPIIHPPQVAIVGFGSVVVRPWCVGGAVVPANVVTATLSADHRVSDGHRGSQFLVEVDRLLQEPEKL